MATSVLEKIKAIFTADKAKIAELEERNATLADANITLKKDVDALKKKLAKALKELDEISQLVEANE